MDNFNGLFRFLLVVLNRYAYDIIMGGGSKLNGQSHDGRQPWRLLFSRRFFFGRTVQDARHRRGT